MVDMLRLRGGFGGDADRRAHTSVLAAIAARDGQTAAALAREHLITLNG